MPRAPVGSALTDSGRHVAYPSGMTTIWFCGGPYDTKSIEVDREIAHLPRYLTYTEAVREDAGFQRGIVYEKSMDNAGADLGDSPQAEYRYVGDTGLLDHAR
jgi:hypothetical protein